VETPGAGKLNAQAHGTIVVKSGKRAHQKRLVLARASGATHAEGTTTLVLRLASRYSRDLSRAGKLKVQITVAFKPPAPAEALSAEANATFLAARSKKTPKGVTK
jgi:hypothetical protein